MGANVEHSLQIYKRVEALRGAICTGVRCASCLLLALLLGVLNPALCLLHCYVSHGLAAASGVAHGREHDGHHAGASASHGHHAGAADASQGRHVDAASADQGPGPCASTALPTAAQPMPRAAYDLTLIPLALGLIPLALVARTPLIPWRPRAARPPRPLTPPPQTPAFA